MIQDLPLNAKWIYITGENGIGKTILLQAIALGLTNYEENIKHLTKGCELTIGFCQNGKHFRNNVVEKYNEDFTNINHHFIGYGPIRLITQASNSQNQESLNSSNIYNLFNKDGLLKNVDYLLLMSYIKESKVEFENLKML